MVLLLLLLKGIRSGYPELTPCGCRVPAGRWNGVLIAVKVVEHTGEHEGGRADIVEGARESLLAASVSHPNVIPCYKVGLWD